MSNGPRYRGKTFHEYMSAKFWHPASKRNIVTVWKRKQQMKAEERKQTERAEEARRENEKNMVQSALGDKKSKLGVSFLYDMPNNIMPRDINAPENQGDLPGMTAKNFEIKFEWQKNAPRDSHFNGMGEVRNSIFNHKPFGIEVRNVKCLKCGAWGHSNFDRTCPLFGKVADRDNPDFDLKREQLELLSSKLQESSTQGYKMKQNIMDGYNIGDTMFDPLEKKRKHKETVPEMEFLSKLDPEEKEALLKSLEKQRKKKKKKEKANKLKLKEEIKKELEKTKIKKEVKIEPEVDIKPEIDSDSDDDDVAPVEIVIPKRKEEIEAERVSEAKKAFAKQLAQMYATMKNDSSSDSESESDSEDSSSDDSVDSDYDSNSPGPSGSSKKKVDEKIKIEDVPENIKKRLAPAPKKGMVLVKKKKIETKPVDDELEKKKKMLAYTQALRKKMEELEKKELLKQQNKLKMSSQKKKNEKSLPSTSTSTKVTDEDLTSGLLNITSKAWSTVPVVNYGSSSEED